MRPTRRSGAGTARRAPATRAPCWRRTASTLAEWQGSYLVGNGRGRTVMAGDLAGCWAAAEQLAGRPADPLAEEAAAALAEARP